MKGLVFFILGFSFCVNLYSAESIFQSIYGKDDRNKGSSYKDEYFKMLSKSVAALIPNENIEMFYFDKLAKISGQDYQIRNTMCSGARFEKNLSTGFCSGFLVAPDLLVTAGHCILDLYDCTQNKWVFDYEFNRVQTTTHFHTFGSNIYSCVEVLSQAYTMSDMDYAVVRLDRAVSDRLPLKFNKSSKIIDKTNLVLIGHPRGLPKVITDNGKVIRNSKDNFFSADLDAFRGNSGGPVFNAYTGLVEGILVRGGNDFEYDLDNDCNRTYSCEVLGDCRGEDVLRMSVVPALDGLGQ